VEEQSVPIADAEQFYERTKRGNPRLLMSLVKAKRAANRKKRKFGMSCRLSLSSRECSGEVIPSHACVEISHEVSRKPIIWDWTDRYAGEEGPLSGTRTEEARSWSTAGHET
jgi:hypothetical protein